MYCYDCRIAYAERFDFLVLTEKEKKKMKKMFALMLALILVISLLPLSVAADSYFNYQSFKPIDSDKVQATKYTGEVVELSTA